MGNSKSKKGNVPPLTVRRLMGRRAKQLAQCQSAEELRADLYSKLENLLISLNLQYRGMHLRDIMRAYPEEAMTVLREWSLQHGISVKEFEVYTAEQLCLADECGRVGIYACTPYEMFIRILEKVSNK